MSALPSGLSKSDLRATALAARDGLSAAQRTAAALGLAARGLPFAIAPGSIVSGYSPIRGELDPAPLMQRLAGLGARLALPAVILRDACRAIDLNGSVGKIEGEFDRAGVMVVDGADVLG